MTIAKHLEQKRLQKGLQKGLQEGLNKGRQVERSEIARNFLSLGTDRALVEQATGLSSAELDALINSTVNKNR
jgi:predicted transposase/invertase (TIGR01784 family)